MWSFENGIEVYEHSEYFAVYNGDTLLGYIHPDTLEGFDDCRKALDSGEDPITGGWEDGLGNSCSLCGWGEFYNEDNAQ